MKKTARQRVYEALHHAGPNGQTTAQLCHPQVGGARFGARVRELREEGHVIEQRYVRPGSHLYVLKAASSGPVVSVAGDDGVRVVGLFRAEGRPLSPYDFDDAA